MPLGDEIAGTARRPLFLLLTAVGVVLPDRLRQPGQPAAGARGLAPPRDCTARRARGIAQPDGPPAADRKPGAVRRRAFRRHPVGAVGVRLPRAAGAAGDVAVHAPDARRTDARAGGNRRAGDRHPFRARARPSDNSPDPERCLAGWRPHRLERASARRARHRGDRNDAGAARRRGAAAAGVLPDALHRSGHAARARADAAHRPAHGTIRRSGAAPQLLRPSARAGGAAAWRGRCRLHDVGASRVEGRHERSHPRRPRDRVDRGTRSQSPSGQRRVLAGDRHALAARSLLRSPRRRRDATGRHRQRNYGAAAMAGQRCGRQTPHRRSLARRQALAHGGWRRR